MFILHTLVFAALMAISVGSALSNGNTDLVADVAAVATSIAIVTSKIPVTTIHVAVPDDASILAQMKELPTGSTNLLMHNASVMTSISIQSFYSFSSHAPPTSTTLTTSSTRVSSAIIARRISAHPAPFIPGTPLVFTTMTRQRNSTNMATSTTSTKHETFLSRSSSVGAHTATNKPNTASKTCATSSATSASTTKPRPKGYDRICANSVCSSYCSCDQYGKVVCSYDPIHCNTLDCTCHPHW